MTQQAQQVLKKSAPVDPVFINTPTGTVAVFGHKYVSKNMLQMLGTALIHDAFETIYHGVKSVVFRIDGYPKSALPSPLTLGGFASTWRKLWKSPWSVLWTIRPPV
jgi:hypothetical protein